MEGRLWSDVSYNSDVSLKGLECVPECLRIDCLPIKISSEDLRIRNRNLSVRPQPSVSLCSKTLSK
jgi:hypothetical protein